MKRGHGFFTFLIGFAAGIAASYWYCDKKHRMRADREIEDVKETLTKQARRGRRIKDEDKDEDEDEPVEIGRSWSSLDIEPPKREAPTDYSRQYGKPQEKEEAPTPATKPEEKEAPHEDRRDVYDESDPPFEITPDEYLGSRNYEHVQLTWFNKDERLVMTEWKEDEDFDGPVIYDVRSVVGDVFEKSGFLKGDIDAIYVRNPSTSTDYEITFSRGGYLM